MNITRIRKKVQVVDNIIKENMPFDSMLLKVESNLNSKELYEIYKRVYNREGRGIINWVKRIWK